MNKIQFEDILKTYYSDDDFDYGNLPENLKKGDERECPLCHKLFYPIGRNRSRQKYCNRTHYINCQICGKPIPQIPPSEKYGAVRCSCSGECTKLFRAQQTKKAMVNKYGYENPSQVPEFKERISAGIRSKSAETTAKVVATMNERYGGMGTASPVLRKKIEATMQERYGITNPDESEEFRKKISDKHKTAETLEKRKTTSRLHYGTDWPTQSEEVQKLMEQTCMNNWGVPYSGQIREAKEKARLTNIKRYGVPCVLNTAENREKARLSMIENSSGRVSKINIAFLNKLKQAGVSAKLEFYLNKMWYDIVIPKQNIVIEIDPSYTHSTVANHWTKGKESNYHVSRTVNASDNGYRCIHIFDWDRWDAIISLVSPTSKVYARNCNLVCLESSQVRDFIEKYHLQGDARGAKYCYGLIYQGELVSTITFGKPRYNKNYQWELLRLCTHPDYSIIGGPSKMLNQFKKDANPESILSYCDRAKFSGEVYRKLGMKLHHVTPPTKVWSNESKYITDNFLRQRGFDQIFGTNYGKGTSNEQLMLEHGWLPVYDCGQFVFEWRKDS